ncbi:MAG: hypothetical protein E7637_02220 [Ruminococcaceae bacterium]|nr:hypothetical protein [Oscillospiraceae bacterium]
MNQLFCGAAERVITPELGLLIPGYFKNRISDGVKSDLKAHAIVLKDGAAQVAVIHLDILDFQASLAKKIRLKIQNQLQIPPSNVMIAATHTHTGSPTNYSGFDEGRLTKKQLDRLINLTVEAVVAASEAAVPVKMYCAFGEEKSIAFNRNYLMNDGTIVTNPGKRRPFDVVKPITPIDHTLGVIRFDALDGTPIAQLVNFACHPDTVGGTAYCADYPGELCRLQQECFGKDFVTVYLNGASGNVNHINAEWYKTPGFVLQKGSHHLHMGKVLSENVQVLHKQMSQTNDTTIKALSKTYRTARRQPTDEDMKWVASVNEAPNASIEDKTYASELTDLYKHPKKFANVEIQVFRIGECAIVTLPCEAYADIALAIREASQHKNLLISSLTNGTVGYVVTEPAFSAGVYESKLSKYNSFLPPSAADEMALHAVQLLKKLS